MIDQREQRLSDDSWTISPSRIGGKLKDRQTISELYSHYIWCCLLSDWKHQLAACHGFGNQLVINRQLLLVRTAPLGRISAPKLLHRLVIHLRKRVADADVASIHGTLVL